MNASKKVSWPIAAATAAAALLTAGSAVADGRGQHHDGNHDRGRGIANHNRSQMSHGSDYRNWRAPGYQTRYQIRHENYRHYAAAPPRTYWRDDWRRDRWRHYHGYDAYRSSYEYPSEYYSSYYAPLWPNPALGARLMIDIR